MDPDTDHLCASLGCVAENLMLAGGALGRATEAALHAAGDGVVQVALGGGGGTAGEEALLAAIP